METVLKTLTAIKKVEEKFVKISENQALYGAEYGLTNQEETLLEKLVDICGEVNIAGDTILKKIIPK